MEKSYLYHQNKLYRHILSCEYHKKPDHFLKKVLELLLLATNAGKGYIEVNRSKEKIFWASDRLESKEISNLRKTISLGIVAKVLEKHEIVKTCSAINDPRFSKRESVRNVKIEAVLCVPLLSDNIKGVIYLQGDSKFQVESEETIDDINLIAKKILPVIEYSCRSKINETYDTISALREKYNIDGIIGKSRIFGSVLKRALMVAPLDINVLITGKTGTGKTHIAGIIHQNSLRKNKPFVELNCAALPDNLIENELFGAIAGGHSSAVKAVSGKVGAAEGGTLFLDEIGELSVSTQAKLLNFMQSGFYYPLGSSKPVKSDVRIITATNINLQDAIEEKKFREDLFFRINVFSLELPSLSKRKEDVIELVQFFSDKCLKKHGFPEIEISSSAINILVNRSWKGNVRELKHTVETAIINATLEGDRKLVKSHFISESDCRKLSFSVESFKSATLDFQREYIKSNLEIRNWNVSKTAKDIEISRSQLNNLIKSFQLSRKINEELHSNNIRV